MEIIGDCLCEDIKKNVGLLSRRNNLEETKMMVEQEVDLLHQLTNIGYKLYVPGNGDVFGGNFVCDTNVWFSKVYGDAIADKKNK